MSSNNRLFEARYSLLRFRHGSVSFHLMQILPGVVELAGTGDLRSDPTIRYLIEP